jgi:DNA (cytosine-5)-methyltransferase 1
MRRYYNEFNPFAAQWLRNAIARGVLPPGDVDDRSIVDVQPSDLHGYTHCHFFAGIGGWALAAQIAGWPDERELWTGSCPCQPYSIIGLQEGEEDERDLWPEYFRLINACWPSFVVGEQVENAIKFRWLDRMRSDLESAGYAARAVVLPACAVDAPQKRERIWFVGDGYGAVGDGECARLEGHRGDGDDATGRTIPCRSVAAPGSRSSSFWSDADWIVGHDGRRRRVQPGIRLLADGVSERPGRLHAYGNAIVPQEGAVVLRALLDVIA